MPKTPKNNTERTPITRGAKHILFKELVPKFKINNPDVKEITLYFSALMENKTDLATMLHDIKSLGMEDNLKLIINSGGGLVVEGKSLINTILGTGANVETELLATAASMAAILFCIGEKRVIYESSSLMFHTYSGEVFGKGQEMKDAVKHKNKNIAAFFRAHLIGLTDKEIEKMIIGKEYWFDAKEMCERGIATHVNIYGHQISAKKYLKLIKKVQKIGRKNNLKIYTLAEALVYNIDAITPLENEYQKDIVNIEKGMNKLIGKYGHILL